MEFIFVDSREFKEFRRDIAKSIRFIKHNAIITILGSLVSYLIIVAMLILLP